jgi:hypothetical protein
MFQRNTQAGQIISGSPSAAKGGNQAFREGDAQHPQDSPHRIGQDVVYRRVSARDETLMKLVRNAVKNCDQDREKVAAGDFFRAKAFVQGPEKENRKERISRRMQEVIRKLDQHGGIYGTGTHVEDKGHISQRGQLEYDKARETFFRVLHWNTKSGKLRPVTVDSVCVQVRGPGQNGNGYINHPTRMERRTNDPKR